VQFGVKCTSSDPVIDPRGYRSRFTYDRVSIPLVEAKSLPVPVLHLLRRCLSPGVEVHSESNAQLMRPLRQIPITDLPLRSPLHIYSLRWLGQPFASSHFQGFVWSRAFQLQAGLDRENTGYRFRIVLHFGRLSRFW